MIVGGIGLSVVPFFFWKWPNTGRRTVWESVSWSFCCIQPCPGACNHWIVYLELLTKPKSFVHQGKNSWIRAGEFQIEQETHGSLLEMFLDEFLFRVWCRRYLPLSTGLCIVCIVILRYIEFVCKFSNFTYWDIERVYIYNNYRSDSCRFMNLCVYRHLVALPNLPRSILIILIVYLIIYISCIQHTSYIYISIQYRYIFALVPIC